MVGSNEGGTLRQGRLSQQMREMTTAEYFDEHCNTEVHKFKSDIENQMRLFEEEAKKAIAEIEKQASDAKVEVEKRGEAMIKQLRTDLTK